MSARDVTAESRRRRAQEFLLAASRALDASLDPAETARTIVDMAVPELAELCVIDFVRGDGLIGDSVAAGVDPQAAAGLERSRGEAPLDPDSRHPVAQVVRTGRPTVWRERPDGAPNGDVEPTYAAGYGSAAVFNLTARGRTLGALSFLRAGSGPLYDSTDLELLDDLAERAAIVLDNARLYQERDRIADKLQRGLRPPHPAEVPGLEISVVFEAAGEGIEVGGDLYDVLPTADGCWIVIGDVAGKGSEAASVSVAVRHSVRGLTREIEQPGEVLRRVNELLLEGTSLNDFATALLIRMREEGGSWKVSLAAAGHPPAVHLAAGGPVQLGGGSMLGARRDLALAEHETTLEAGETLILYTDGWTEAGPPIVHRDPEALADIARELSDRPVEEVTQRLRFDAITRSGGSLNDDLVVLAVRPAAGSRARRGADSARGGQASPG